MVLPGEGNQIKYGLKQLFTYKIFNPLQREFQVPF